MPAGLCRDTGQIVFRSGWRPGRDVGTFEVTLNRIAHSLEGTGHDPSGHSAMLRLTYRHQEAPAQEPKIGLVETYV